MRTLRPALLILALITHPSLSSADQRDPSGAVASPDTDRLPKGAVELAAVFGTTLPITLARAKPDSHLTFGSLQLGKVLTGRRGPGPLAGNFEVLLDLTPVMRVGQAGNGAYGVAASPVHVRWNFAPLPTRPWRVFAEISGGVLLTSAPVPLSTTRVNFIDEGGFGIRLEQHPRRTWLLGYRIQHVSNGGRAQPNPGANFHFVYAGISTRR